MNYTSPRETRRTMEGEEEEDGFTYQREISCQSLICEDPSLAGGNRLQIHHRSLIRARSVANQSSSSPEAEKPHGATGRSSQPAESWICPPWKQRGLGRQILVSWVSKRTIIQPEESLPRGSSTRGIDRDPRGG